MLSLADLIMVIEGPIPGTSLSEKLAARDREEAAKRAAEAAKRAAEAARQARAERLARLAIAKKLLAERRQVLMVLGAVGAACIGWGLQVILQRRGYRRAGKYIGGASFATAGIVAGYAMLGLKGGITGGLVGFFVWYEVIRDSPDIIENPA